MLNEINWPEGYLLGMTDNFTPTKLSSILDFQAYVNTNS